MQSLPENGPAVEAAWRLAWRRGFGPRLPTAGLRALAAALACDDPRLTQGTTLEPAPLAANAGGRPTGADPVAFALWMAAGPDTTVGDVDEAWARACWQAVLATGDPDCPRWFLNGWDERPREQGRFELLAEVRTELARRRRTGKATRGSFRRGPDGRRHHFTREEQSRGGRTSWQRFQVRFRLQAGLPLP